MKLPKFIRSAPRVLSAAVPVILANRVSRTLLGAGITAGFALVGLHVDAEQALALIGLGAALAAAGPHKSADEGNDADA